MEKWIAQKRAEIAKEKAEIGGDKENNVPPTVTSKSQPPSQINRGAVGQPVQSNEPLIFKLGDDYQLRKESGTPFPSKSISTLPDSDLGMKTDLFPNLSPN